MSSFAGIRSLFYKVVSISTCLAVVAMTASPSGTPARGDAPLRLAVTTFQNQANAPAAVINAMSASLYQSISSSGGFTAVGGGPLDIKRDVSGGSFGPALDAAAKVGADEVVIGNIVSYANGQAYYSLSIYRVTNVMLVRSQVFTQPYPAADSHSMAAAFASNIATLQAPRTAMGTIYETDNNEIDADLGTSQGFSLGQHFNVLRNGTKVAQAEITKISDTYAVVTIINPSPGYKAAVGDRLVGLDAQPALLPPPNTASKFNPLWLILGAGIALLAIGHGGTGVAPNPQPTITGGGGVFTISGLQVTGNPQQQPITFIFTFTQPFNTTAFDPSSNLSLAYAQITSQGGSFLRINTLGPVTYFPSNTAATQMTLVTAGSIIQANDHISFVFLDGSGNGWVDNNSDLFSGIQFNPFSIFRRPLGAVHKVHAPPPVPVPHPAPSPH